MADGFRSGICSSSGKWWNNTLRSGSSPCSTAVTDRGNISYGSSWPSDSDQMVVSSCEETASVSGSSNVYNQDAHKSRESDSGGGGVLMDSTLQMMDFGLSCPTSDHWAQALLHGSSGGRSQSNFSSMLEESAHRHHQQQQQVQKDWSADQKNYSGEDSSSNISELNKQINQVFALEQQGSNMDSSTTSSFLQGLFEPDHHHHLQPQHHQPQPNYENLTVNYNRANSLPHQFIKTSSPPKHQLHFSNNIGFSFFASPPQTQFEEKPNCGINPTLKPNREEVREKKSSTSSEATFKRPRIETPTPLPTFKVRKEKLGDRITALQQLVSPFGKTDTASVLFEAIEYIKFLHEQVSALSTPYMKSGGPVQYQQMNSDKSKDGERPKQDLRSRGLCLVPISSTFPVTTETTADFWTPTFGGTYR